jgi:ubiquinone/menaquinone biosynthesis C-methylase UbiE
MKSMPPPSLHSVIECSRRLLRPVLMQSGAAADATAGNGEDTRFLAESLGPEGAVYAFDVQEEAIARARAALAGLQHAAPVHFFRAGHENMRALLPVHLHGALDAVMFRAL